jgi:GH24 family phage-related lysozyme (muramidase)
MKKVIITEAQLKSIVREAALTNTRGPLTGQTQQQQSQTSQDKIDWLARLRDFIAKRGFGVQQKEPASMISDNALSQICKWETAHEFGYQMAPKDLYGYYGRDNRSGKKTYGYGLLYHPNGKQFMQDVKQVWTQPELEELFKQKILNEVQYVLNWAQKNGITLGQGQLDAMVSAVYNFGRQGFINRGIPRLIAQDPDNPQIPQLWAHLSDSQVRRPGLKKRREVEANWYQSDIQQA